MAAAKVYLVPVDFSKSSAIALDYAMKLAKEKKGKLLLVHVITETAGNVPFQFRAEYYAELEEEARRTVEKLAKRRRLKPNDYRFMVVRGRDPARLVTRQAKRSRASVIVMGSHGRTGLGRLILGSVAEKTIRYADCPVLIVKK